MTLLEKILKDQDDAGRNFRAHPDLTSDPELEGDLHSLHDKYLAIMAMQQDGNVLQLVDGLWDPCEGGRVFVTGKIVAEEDERWGDLVSCYFDIQSLTGEQFRIYVDGILAGFVFGDEQLHQLLESVLTGADHQPLSEALAKAGFERLL